MTDELDEPRPARPNRHPNPLTAAPEYRKGAMKAAILQARAEQAEALTAEVVVAVGATSLRELALRAGEKAILVLEQDLADPDPRARQEAARALAAVCTKFAEMAPAPEAEPSDEEREAQLERALQSPKLRAFLEARGWRKAEP